MPKQSITAKEIINNYGATFALIVAIIVFSFTSRGFFSGQNLQNILVQSTSLGICAFGLTFVLLTGEIDMSYAGVIGLVARASVGLRESLFPDSAESARGPESASELALDLELAARRKPGPRSDDLVGEMLGRLVGTLAFVADPYDGVRVIDISTPATPAEVGFVDETWFALGIATDGRHAYVAATGTGLVVVDVSFISLRLIVPVTLGIIPPRKVALESAVDVVKKDLIQALRESGEIPSVISTTMGIVNPMRKRNRWLVT